MDPKQFDSVIAGLTELGAKIAAINARPFMPDPYITFSRIKAKTASLSQGESAKKANRPTVDRPRKRALKSKV
jgi:hypothetical protein